MIAVIYDEKTGEISECATAPDSYFKGKPHVIVDKHYHDLDLTHVVLGGRLVPRPDLAQRTAAQAATKLRIKRDAALRDTVDTMNPMRWTELTDAQRAAWTAYRRALLDLPATGVWPEMPK